MTVEVRELTINATIIQGAEQDSNRKQNSDDAELSQSEIIAACVEQVLRVLEHSKER